MKKLIVSVILSIIILNPYSNIEIVISTTKEPIVQKQELHYELYDKLYSPSILNTNKYVFAKQKNNNISCVTSVTPYYDIPLSKELQKYTYDLVQKYKTTKFFNAKLVYAVIKSESNFDPNIISSTADYGLMQINISNHKWLSKKLGISNFLNAKENIKAGVFILHYLAKKYEYKGIHYILTAYNRGESGATNYLRSRNSSTYSRIVIKNLENIKEKHK